jgi:hypothetical protein
MAWRVFRNYSGLERFDGCSARYLGVPPVLLLDLAFVAHFNYPVRNHPDLDATWVGLNHSAKASIPRRERRWRRIATNGSLYMVGNVQRVELRDRGLPTCADSFRTVDQDLPRTCFSAFFRDVPRCRNVGTGQYGTHERQDWHETPRFDQ